MNMVALCKELTGIRERMNADRARAMRIEEEIAREIASGRDEGTVTALVEDLFKVSVTKKLNRKIDEQEWNRIRDMIPEGLSPVKYKPVLDLKKYRAIEAANPALHATVARAITARPGKPSVKVVQLEPRQEAA